MFLEGGLDQYFADAATPMDRISTIGTVAGGLRMFPGAWVSLHVQVGAGVELTRVSMEGHRRSDALPVGFLGLGADARLLEHLRLGLNVRLYGMGIYEHEDTAVLDEMEVEPAMASQGQFYLRYDL